jgi:hypothetical protein
MQQPLISIWATTPLIRGPVGKFPPPFFFPSAHKIKQQKKPEKRDGPWTDHSTISAKPHFDASLLPAPFCKKEFNSLCKEIANSGNITA